MKNFQKKYGKGKRARERHAQEKGKTCLRQSPFYGFRPKNIRSWYQKRTVLGRKTYGLGTKNVKRKRLKQKNTTPFALEITYRHKKRSTAVLQPLLTLNLIL